MKSEPNWSACPRRRKSVSDCIPWGGSIDANGYGRIGSKVYAHIEAYKSVHGDIPPGLVIDHTCHNPSCVNPQHLRVVTPKQNCENVRGAQVNNASRVRGVVWHGRAADELAALRRGPVIDGQSERRAHAG